MAQEFIDSQWYQVLALGLGFFSCLYLGMGSITIALTRWIFPAISYGGMLDPRPLGKGQIRRELTYSLASIAIFGSGLLVPWYLLKIQWAALGQQTSYWKLVLEIIVLLLWNEVHFYFIHRLLHFPLLKRFHLVHHRSLVTTPWGSYSFHPIEAILLGSVILLPMCLYDFSFTSLAALPIFSIIFNNIGHSNYDFLPDARRDRWWLNGARRHHLHHACYQGNYGFMLPFMDRLCRTELAPDAAARKLRF